MFIVTSRPENVDILDLEKKGGCRLLGEVFIELGPLTAPLTDISGDGVR